MSIVDKPKTYTADEWLELPDRKRFELVNGELVEKYVSVESSHIAGELIFLLKAHVRTAKSGMVFGPDCGYKCFEKLTDDPDRLRLPDVTFIAAGRLTQEQYEAGYVEVVPDLAVEVVSPNDRVRDLDEKLEEYLQADVKLVWIIHPKTKTVDVHRPDGSDSRLRQNDSLSGENVIPGFECKVEELFPALP